MFNGDTNHTPGQFTYEVSDPLLVLVTQILQRRLPALVCQVNVLAVVAIAAVVAVVCIARLKETCLQTMASFCSYNDEDR